MERKSLGITHQGPKIGKVCWNGTEWCLAWHIAWNSLPTTVRDVYILMTFESWTVSQNGTDFAPMWQLYVYSLREHKFSYLLTYFLLTYLRAYVLALYVTTEKASTQCVYAASRGLTATAELLFFCCGYLFKKCVLKYFKIYMKFLNISNWNISSCISTSVRLSIRPPVCHTQVLYQNGWTYCHAFFTTRYPIHSSFAYIKIFAKLKFRRGHRLRGR